MTTQTIDDYNIQDKAQLTNTIQDKRIFSKLDCKFGFGQIKLHKESIE